MWNKRKEDEYPPKAAPQPSAPATSSKEPYPAMSTAPASGFHTPERGAAVIGKSVMVKGQIFSREDLTIDGEVEGSVELQENRLTVGPHGRLQAGVKAREIVVLGAINGNIETSDKIEIRKDAKLVGDIKTARIVIEDGAYFKGAIDIIKPEVKPAPPPPKLAPAPPPQPAVAASAGPTEAKR
jgi:cytoskeletal protein CcmA (bactofilin family)